MPSAATTNTGLAWWKALTALAPHLQQLPAIESAITYCWHHAVHLYPPSTVDHHLPQLISYPSKRDDPLLFLTPT